MSRIPGPAGEEFPPSWQAQSSSPCAAGVSQSRARRSRLRRAAAVLGIGLPALAAVAVALFLFFAPNPLEQVLHWPVSPVMLDRDGTLIHARLAENDEWCLPIPLSEMGDWLPKVLVAVEDKRFYSHPGVDVLALGRAVGQNMMTGRVVSGASTITSQLVRLSTPRKRTLEAKALEFAGALKLERALSKEEILEYYLNRAPFGGPIRGVEAAARIYFGKRAKDVSLGEAALLVGLLKGPTAYRPDRNPKAALERRQSIIRKVADQTGFDPDLTALALQEPLPRFRPAMPAEASHFADLVFAVLPETGGVARTTLDMRAQRLLERTLREHLPRTSPDVTAAGIIVENRSGEIIAYVGNAQFDPAAGKHWVDCAVAPRSPGSTLKPFIYLAAMEEGRIIPAGLLADTPLQLGGAAPRNFDRLYRGPVSVRTALADSLNAPAVRVMRLIGVERALHKLRNAGFAHLSRKDSDYGDSLVLGAGETTALELARAYAALANLGMDRPLLLLKPNPAAQPAPDARAFPRGCLQISNFASKERKPALFAKEVYSSHTRPEEKGPDDEAVGQKDYLETAPMALEAYGSSRSRFSDAPPRADSLPPGTAPPHLQRQAAAGVPPAPVRLHSAPAAYLIADILKDPGRLPFLFRVIRAAESAPIAFKTGTSYGLRDAWTAAYTPDHTVVVWFGKASGKPDPLLVGIRTATPAAVAVLRELPATRTQAAASGKNGMPAVRNGWYTPPEGIEEARVCSLSGAVPNAACPSTRNALHIRDLRRTTVCPIHALRNGKTDLLWPPELEDYARRRFAREDLSRAALIVSPMPGARYVLTPGARNRPVALKAEGAVYPVHWYADGQYLGVQEEYAVPLYWQPTDGTHTLSLLDADDRVASTDVDVTDLGAEAGAPLPVLGR